MIIDTSVFIAAYDENDPRQTRALELIKIAEENEKIFISDYIINELATVAMRRLGLKKAKEIVNAVTNTKEIIVTYTAWNEFNAVLEIFKNQQSNLSFVDCHITWMARAMNQKVATFDKNLEKHVQN